MAPKLPTVLDSDLEAMARALGIEVPTKATAAPVPVKQARKVSARPKVGWTFVLNIFPSSEWDHNKHMTQVTLTESGMCKELSLNAARKRIPQGYTFHSVASAKYTS